jgi:hypothetical protein
MTQSMINSPRSGFGLPCLGIGWCMSMEKDDHDGGMVCRITDPWTMGSVFYPWFDSFARLYHAAFRVAAHTSTLSSRQPSGQLFIVEQVHICIYVLVRRSACCRIGSWGYISLKGVKIINPDKESGYLLLCSRRRR